MNLYAYVQNDPLNASDPSGLDPACPPGTDCGPDIPVPGAVDTRRDRRSAWGANSGIIGSSRGLAFPRGIRRYSGGQTAPRDMHLRDIPLEPYEVVVTAPPSPPPPAPSIWLLLRPTVVGVFVWVFTPTDLAIADCGAMPELCRDDEPAVEPPYMTSVDPERLRAHEECNAMCREIFVRDPNALPGVGRNYQARMGRCVWECMIDRGYTPF
jgi:hypothetical protein